MALLVGEAKTCLQFPLLALHELGSADFSENLFLSVFKAACMLLKRQRGSRPDLVKVTSLTTNFDPSPKSLFLVPTPKELPSFSTCPPPALLLDNVRYCGAFFSFSFF